MGRVMLIGNVYKNVTTFVLDDLFLNITPDVLYTTTWSFFRYCDGFLYAFLRVLKIETKQR